MFCFIDFTLQIVQHKINIWQYLYNKAWYKILIYNLILQNWTKNKIVVKLYTCYENLSTMIAYICFIKD